MPVGFLGRTKAEGLTWDLLVRLCLLWIDPSVSPPLNNTNNNILMTQVNYFETSVILLCISWDIGGSHDPNLLRSARSRSWCGLRCGGGRARDVDGRACARQASVDWSRTQLPADAIPTATWPSCREFYEERQQQSL